MRSDTVFCDLMHLTCSNLNLKWDTVFTDYSCKIVPFEGEKVQVCEYIAPKSAIVYCGVKDNGTDFGEVKVIKKAVGDNCECITLKAGQTLVMDFGEDIVGRPSIAINALNGTVIKTLFADLTTEMHAAVERTPEVLTVLKDAGEEPYIIGTVIKGDGGVIIE